MKINYLNEHIFKNIKDIKTNNDEIDENKAKISYLNYIRPKIEEVFADNIDNIPSFIRLGGKIDSIKNIDFNDNSEIEIIFNVRPNTYRFLKFDELYLEGLTRTLTSLKTIFTKEIYNNPKYGIKKSLYNITFKLDMGSLCEKDLYIDGNIFHFGEDGSILHNEVDLQMLCLLFEKYVIWNNVASITITCPAFSSFEVLKPLSYIIKAKFDLNIVIDRSTYPEYVELLRRNNNKFPSLKGLEDLCVYYSCRITIDEVLIEIIDKNEMIDLLKHNKIIYKQSYGRCNALYLEDYLKLKKVSL